MGNFEIIRLYIMFGWKIRVGIQATSAKPVHTKDHHKIGTNCLPA